MTEQRGKHISRQITVVKRHWHDGVGIHFVSDLDVVWPVVILICSILDPLEEDVCMLADYLISILPTDLARVRRLLRMLRGLIEGEGIVGDPAPWKHAFKRLKATIDAACRRHYNVDSLELDMP